MTTNRITLHAQHPHTPTKSTNSHKATLPPFWSRARITARPPLPPPHRNETRSSFGFPSPGIMHITDTRSFECRDETAFRETRLPAHRVQAHIHQNPHPHPDKLLNESFTPAGPTNPAPPHPHTPTSSPRHSRPPHLTTARPPTPPILLPFAFANGTRIVKKRRFSHSPQDSADLNLEHSHTNNTGAMQTRDREMAGAPPLEELRRRCSCSRLLQKTATGGLHPESFV